MACLLRRWFHALVVLSAFVLFWTGGTLYAWVVLPIAWLTAGGGDAGRRRCHALVRRGWTFFLDYMRVTRLLHCDPREYAAARLPEGPFVLVSNHPTLIDVIALNASLGSMCTVVKPSIWRSPSVNFLCRLLGHVRGARGGVFEGKRVMDECLARLQAGYPVLMFPEGTRSPAGGLDAFQRAPFEIAARAGVPLQPVFIGCDPPMLMKGMPWYRVPEEFARYRLRLLPAMTVEPGRSAVRAAAGSVRKELQIRVDSSIPARFPAAEAGWELAGTVVAGDDQA